jgi:predicted enzyme related to lactoylglutathione lyase
VAESCWPSIRTAIAKVLDAGGTVLGEPTEMPGVGLFADFVDPDGNRGTLNQDFTIGQL